VTGAACAFFQGDNGEQVTALKDRAGLRYHRVTKSLALRP